MATKSTIPESPWDWPQELVLVTGGSAGIGAMTAQNFASKGVNVVILDLHPPKENLGPGIHFYACDVTDSSQIRKVATAIHDAFGHPTVLINNAGVGFGGTILDEPEENIRATFAVNTIAQFLLVKQFLPAMIERNHGHVVTIGSIASFVTIAQNVDYSCSKAAAVAFHEGLKQELKWRYGADGVRTSIIYPNWVRTRMVTKLERDQKFLDSLLDAEDVADAIVRQVMSERSSSKMLPGWMAIVKGIRGWPMWLQELVRNSQQSVLANLPATGYLEDQSTNNRVGGT